ncbi:hypothetical protein MAPG_09667 [Magnaporthiopsis poae ATCC 64411]|uniref:Uncharacterized protein n=1 Tax=Magnaporthiopsis poae (strain ATCC 64411 / 73-15) TaxID=644358 RepID=A0A0C4EAJ3_MAGP6|nr:hypothetical protein MAPG_09667 [Magnaporthiopsis poae ATCC 64411]
MDACHTTTQPPTRLISPVGRDSSCLPREGGQTTMAGLCISSDSNKPFDDSHRVPTYSHFAATCTLRTGVRGWSGLSAPVFWRPAAAPHGADRWWLGATVGIRLGDGQRLISISKATNMQANFSSCYFCTFEGQAFRAHRPAARQQNKASKGWVWSATNIIPIRWRPNFKPYFTLAALNVSQYLRE